MHKVRIDTKDEFGDVRTGELGTVTERVLSVATAAFAEHGWRDSTVDALCRRAGITSSEFYAAYATVDDLFVEMYRHEAQAMVAAVRSALQPLTDGRAGSTAATAITSVATALTAATSDRDWWIITTEYMLRAVRHPEVAATYRELRRETNREMAGAISAALQSADVDDRFDVDQFVEIIGALHRGAVAQSFLEPDSSSPQLLDQRVWTAVLQGSSR